MKTKEELNALKEEVENLNNKLAELSEDEMEEVTGGIVSLKQPAFIYNMFMEKSGENITQALQNRIAGVKMQNSDSQPGKEMQTRIRGQRSLSASNDPLLVSDSLS